MPKIKYLTPAPKVNHLAALFRAYRRERNMTSRDIADRLMGILEEDPDAGYVAVILDLINERMH